MTEAATPGGVAPLRWQRATLREIGVLTPRIRRFVFEPTVPFDFRAGQHVQVRLTAEDGYQAQRAYSIASAPEAPTRIELAIDRLEEGEVSPYFHDIAAVGDAIELRGPIGGHFVWEAKDGDPVVLVGGGSGVVPLVAMARHRDASAGRAPMLLLVSARTFDDVAYRDELLRLDGAASGFRLVIATTREPARRPGDFARRADAAMLAEILGRLPSLPARAYVCGANPFVSSVAQALADAGLALERIRTERYGG